MGSTPCPSQSTPLATHRYTAASVIDTASKYKMLWKLPLEDTDIIKGEAGLSLSETGAGVGFLGVLLPDFSAL